MFIVVFSLEVALLIKTRVGSRLNFIYLITIEMLLSTIGSFGLVYTSIKGEGDQMKSAAKAWLQGVSIFLITFQYVALWSFTYKYWIVSIEMPFVLKGPDNWSEESIAKSNR